MTSKWSWRQVFLPWREPANTSNVFALNGWKNHLYLGTRNLMSGGEVFRSEDGTTWESASAPGFGDEFNRDIYGFVDFQNRLYAGTYNGIHHDFTFSKGMRTDPVGGAQVWRSCEGQSGECMIHDGFGDPNNQDTFNFIEYEGALYVGTFNPETGAEIHRSGDGRRWNQVYKTGSAKQDYIRAFGIMNGRLYASVGKLGPVALLETTDGRQWIDVMAGQIPKYLTDAIRIAVDHDTLVAAMTKWRSNMPLEMWRYRSGIWDRISPLGFGNPNNCLAGGMVVHHGRIVAATWNEVDGTEVWLCNDVGNPEWKQINQSGVGDSRNVGCVFGMAVYQDKLYIGTATIPAESFPSQLWVGTEE